MISRELKERLADFFEANELVEYLAIPVASVIDAFEDEIEECVDDLEELMGLRNGESFIFDRFSEEPSDT